jgi:hypothetical protein
MNQPALLDFSLDHVNALLEKLHREHETVALSNESVNRLFFVDSDVLSVYINGKCTNHASSWPSLFALLPRQPSEDAITEEKIAIEAKAVNNGIARAVTRYLFGPFRDSRQIQGRQLWLMPEQQREFDCASRFGNCHNIGIKLARRVVCPLPFSLPKVRLGFGRFKPRSPEIHNVKGDGSACR